MDKPADDLEMWREGARELMPMVVALRRELHKYPELGLHLPETTRRAREALAGLDVEIADSKTTTSMIVTLRGAQQGPTILLRGDMDALPMPEDTDLEFKSTIENRMHACGHDSHTAMLVGAVHLLHKHRGRLNGNVKFFFQTGEEGFAGARHVIDEGMLDAAPAPSAAFAIHISPNIPTGVIATRSGPLMAATDTIRIEIKGKGGHASQPHYTLDPIPVACEIVTALQSVVTRKIEAFDPVVLSITKITSGTTGNVIPENAKLLGTLRSFSDKSRSKAREAIAQVAEGIARAHGLEAIVDLEPGYPVTVNDGKFVAFAQGVATDLFGERGFLTMPAPIMGAEDFSYVLQRMPGCMAFLGVAPHDVSHNHAHACHSNRMTMDEDAMANGIAMHAAIAERFLTGAG
ncbi:MAG TPA: M20 family metallopeptidase [Rhizomicrobium sp.]|jgi:amidohydrolase|nr:M20 family metallopeptidase [Rhizomicrobium sp.]